MRIIAGHYRGRQLKAVPGLSTRPTADRVKEAVFSAIEPYLREAVVLDLFSGTGNIALEALSRGAKKAVLVEKDSLALKVIRDNVAKCGVSGNCIIFQDDAFQVLERLGQSHQQFDLIYLDPPYQDGLYERALGLIEKKQLLKTNGVIVVESAKNALFLLENSIFCIYRERNYGETKISLVKYQTTMEEESF